MTELTDLPDLEQAARAVAAHAHAPYSKFRVGAAVLGGSGQIHAGCNVENASYGLTSCAERNAICAAVAAGEIRIDAVALYTPTPTPTPPCGACLQVIAEFGPQARIVAFCDGPQRLDSTLPALLPGGFSAGNLRRSESALAQ